MSVVCPVCDGTGKVAAGAEENGNTDDLAAVDLELPTTETTWRTWYPRAVEEARDLKKPLLIYVTQDDCRVCKLVEKHHPDLQKWLQEFILYREDATGEDARFKVKQTPTHIVRVGSRELMRFVPSTDAAKYREQLKTALSKAQQLK